MRRILIVIISVLILGLYHMSTFAAVGCTLNDPDRDVRRIFPESTGYRTAFITIEEKGAEALKNEVENELGDNLDPVYEGIDAPYAFYAVLKGKEIIGYIHGVNQKGKYGGMQLILATDLEGKIKAFYYQKISSPEASKFMDKKFTDKFTGLGLEDLLRGNNLNIADPSTNSSQDFKATLRGLRKNLILLNKLLPEKTQ